VGETLNWQNDADSLVPRHHRHPLHPNVRRSPYFAATERAGAVEYMVYNHMYMPMDYGRRPEEDYRALVERVSLWDVGAERQTELLGPDALSMADYLCARDLSGMAVGECRYSVVCDDAGSVMAECIVLRPFEDVVWISHGDVDLTLWAKAISLHTRWRVAVSEPDVAPLQVQGPRSAETVAAVAGPAVLDLAPYRCLVQAVLGTDIVISRTGWSGGPGYELYPLTSGRALELWDVLAAAGKPHGLLVSAPNLIRACERAITDTHYAVNCNMNPFEMGAGWSVDLQAGPFVGKEVVSRAAQAPPTRKTVGLVATSDGQLPRMETFWPVSSDLGDVGVVRWAVRSIALERPIAIALVDSHLEQGQHVIINHPAGALAAEVTGLPFVR
jgi:glycine cleavage system aminomethyltransferase T